MKFMIAWTTFVLTAGLMSASAQESITYPYDGDFDDATFAVESAIVGQGLVIDSVSHVGEMLNRTAADVGGDQVIFENADIFQFCSAVISRQVMEIDPMNIVFCPYGIFVADTGEGVIIGHRDFPEGEMQMVEDLLAGIVDEAVNF